MLVFYLAALDSDDNKNKFETIYRKYYRFMLHTAAGIIKNPTLAAPLPVVTCNQSSWMPYMKPLCSCCAKSTPCASTTSGR